MRTLPFLAFVALLSACGSSDGPACSAVLPPTHLVNGLCDGGPGYCFYDHETPF